MDFGFMRASSADYTAPNLETDRVVQSFDGFVAYLLIVDEASRFVWVFLRKSKEPPTDLVSHFLQMYGRHNGGVIRCDQGGELARSAAFRTTLFDTHMYVVEPTGADSPSQNGGAEKCNDSLAVTTPSQERSRHLEKFIGTEKKRNRERTSAECSVRTYCF